MNQFTKLFIISAAVLFMGCPAKQGTSGKFTVQGYNMSDDFQGDSRNYDINYGSDFSWNVGLTSGIAILKLDVPSGANSSLLKAYSFSFKTSDIQSSVLGLSTVYQGEAWSNENPDVFARFEITETEAQDGSKTTVHSKVRLIKAAPLEDLSFKMHENAHLSEELGVHEGTKSIINLSYIAPEPEQEKPMPYHRKPMNPYRQNYR